MPSVVFFAIVFAFIAWLSAFSMRPNKDAATILAEDAETLESVTVCYRKERVWVGGLLTLGPLVALPRILKEYAKPDAGEAFGIACLMFGLTLPGAWMFAYARRKIVFNREAVTIVGLAPKRIEWSELGSIKTTYGKIVRFFSKDEKLSIDIDSTMEGFSTLVRVLPGLVTGRSRELVEQAWADIRVTARKAD